VWQVSSAVRVPVIGCGGIMASGDALEFIMAGAAAVQVGTATFRDPLAPLHVVEGVERYCVDNNVADIRELIGCAKVEGPAPYWSL
jgi:dihydroorotate dehydrogenase (NAD+) catalytic subunit